MRIVHEFAKVFDVMRVQAERVERVHTLIKLATNVLCGTSEVFDDGFLLLYFW